MGHLEGDLVLARIGRLLESKVRQSNVVARYGGDEFVILMPETGMEQAQILSERLRLWLATDTMLNERHVTGSFGVATFPIHGSSAEDIVRLADSGMYISKRAGGNKVSTVEVSSEASTSAEQHRMLSTLLEPLLRRDRVPIESEVIAVLRRVGESTSGNTSAAMAEAVRVLTRSLETRELHSAGHGESVASYAQAVGRELMISEAEMRDLIFAAQAHDVGKIVVSESILNKAGQLTFSEYQIVKEHPLVGGNIIASIPGFERAANFVHHHQERYDGTGYPGGLKGEEIPLGARIISVAEAYVNMISERPYAASKSPMDAMLELERMSGTQFDGMLVRLLLKQLRGDRVARAT
jgi:HD-GYP domain-containing protein (c-di-GMP phosphodiesterase class II)